jgi:ATP-dependent protease HslVU (ClpYQ) peptidase subunit
LTYSLSQLRDTIAARLERVRGNLTDAEFATLVADVARTTRKFEQLEAHHLVAVTGEVFIVTPETPIPRG